MALRFWKKAAPAEPREEELLPNPEASPLASLLTQEWLLNEAGPRGALAALQQARALLADDTVSYAALLALLASVRSRAASSPPPALAPLSQRAAALFAAGATDAEAALLRFTRAVCQAYRLQAHAFGLWQRLDASAPRRAGRPPGPAALHEAFPRTYGGGPLAYLDPALLQDANLGPRVAGPFRADDVVLSQRVARSLAEGVPALLTLRGSPAQLIAALDPGPRWVLFDLIKGSSRSLRLAELGLVTELLVYDCEDPSFLDALPTS